MINYNRLAGELKRDFLNFSKKITKNISLPNSKFITQMMYGLLEGNKAHLSEIARSLHETTALKYTIKRLSRNLSSFDAKDSLIENYMKEVKKQIKDDYSVIIIDNSDIAKPYTEKFEAITTIRDGSKGEYVNGYQTIEAAVLSKDTKLPLPVYENVFSSAEDGFISENDENIKCLKFLSKNFKKNCIRTLDRGYDANDYYRYFIKNNEKFIIRAKKNRNVIYKGKTVNILEVANKYKGNFSIKFHDKNGKTIDSKMSYIPVKLCEFPDKELLMITVYGFGKTPMMLITNLKSSDKKAITKTVVKVYLMRWRIEEYFRFKKETFDFEDIRTRTLKSIRNFSTILMLVVGYIGIMSYVKRDTYFFAEIKECAKRIFKVSKFIYYAVGSAIENILSKTYTSINKFLIPKKVQSQQLTFADYLKIDDY